MQKRNSIIRAFSFHNEANNKDWMQSLNKSKPLGVEGLEVTQKSYIKGKCLIYFKGDKSTMSCHIDTVLLPKHITDSFYGTWLHCYEELFEASLSSKSSHFKFERSSRKDAEKLNLEKTRSFGMSLDTNWKERYTQRAETYYEEEENNDSERKNEMNSNTSEDSSYESFNLKSSSSGTNFFSGRKKGYKISYNSKT